MIPSSAICLALAIFFESRNQPIEGQKAVANVVLNRLERDKKSSVCDVVYKPSQFSWTVEKGKPHKAKEKAKKIDSKAWKKSLIIANASLAASSDNTNGAIYFNTIKLGVRYRTKTRPKYFGQHVFY